MFYVYVIFRPNGIPCYVGKGKGNRWMGDTARSRYNPHFAAIIKKAKMDNQELTRIKVRENLTEDDAFQIEVALIAAIGRRKNGGCLVNMTDGGEGLSNPSTEVRAKMSAKAKARITPELIARVRTIGILSKGIPKSAQMRERLRIVKIGVKATLEHRAAVVAGIKAMDPEKRKARIKNFHMIGQPGPITDRRRYSIQCAVKAYWDQRRQAGLPLRHPRRHAAIEALEKSQQRGPSVSLGES